MTPSNQRRLLHVFPSFALGGSQARLVRLIDALGDQYWHDIVSINGDESAAPLIGERSNVRFIPCPRHKSGLGRLLAFRSLIRRSSADVLLTYNWGAIDFALANLPGGVRHVQVEDGFGPEESQQRLWRRSMTRRLVLKAGRSTMVVPSQTLKQIALSEWRLNERAVNWIPNGMDPQRYQLVESRGRPSRYALAPDELVVGTLAGLRPEKTLEVMIEAVASLRAQSPVRLVIAGSGPLGSDLRRFCVERGHDEFVSFIGFQPDPSAAVLEFDVFCLSSVTEQLPISMIEAMFAGLPVAATDVGDIRISLPEGQHPYLSRHSAADLAAVIRPLLVSSQLRGELGKANRSHAERRFSFEPMLEGWRQVLNQQ